LHAAPCVNAEFNPDQESSINNKLQTTMLRWSSLAELN